MDIRGLNRMDAEFRIWQVAEVPEWARAEHLERIIPLKELYSAGSSSTGKKIFERISKLLGGNQK